MVLRLGTKKQIKIAGMGTKRYAPMPVANLNVQTKDQPMTTVTPLSMKARRQDFWDAADFGLFVLPGVLRSGHRMLVAKEPEFDNQGWPERSSPSMGRKGSQ
jgi:hypothetical protein